MIRSARLVYTDPTMPFDVFAPIGGHIEVACTLTDEHPASSYGLPVLIDQHGQAIELPEDRVYSLFIGDETDRRYCWSGGLCGLWGAMTRESMQAL